MPKKNGFTPIILLVVILLVIGGIWLGISRVKETQVTTPTPVAVDTTNWKEYSNKRYRISFKYPSDFKFEEQYVEVGVLAWEATISNPKIPSNDDIKNIQDIGVAVRRRNNLTLQGWVNNECRNIENIADIEVSGKPAKKFSCLINGYENGWVIVAIDNGDYIYALSDVGFKKDSNQQLIFDQILSTFKFTN